MAEIEFVDQHEVAPVRAHPPTQGAPPGAADELPDELPEGRGRRRAGPLLRVWAPAVLAAAAVALAVVTSFQRVLALAGINGTDQVFFAQDAWGRYRQPGPGALATHASRYGVVMCVAAGLMLTGAVLRLLGRLRPRPGLSAVSGAATGVLCTGVGLLAGAVASAALEVSSVSDTYRAQLELAGRQDSAQTEPHVVAGPVFAVGIAAVALGLVAALLPAVLAWFERRGPGGTVAATAPVAPPVASATPAHPPGPAYVAHPDDEVLDA